MSRHRSIATSHPLPHTSKHHSQLFAAECLLQTHPPPSAILFIDDIHTITGPNAQQGGGVMDASVMLKPLLSR